MVITFGEIMMRLATPGYLRLNQSPVLEMTFGGGEANVAVSLTLFGEEATFVTRLPQNDIAETCIQRLRGLGVDTTKILRGGDRIVGIVQEDGSLAVSGDEVGLRAVRAHTLADTVKAELMEAAR